MKVFPINLKKWIGRSASSMYTAEELLEKRNLPLKSAETQAVLSILDWDDTLFPTHFLEQIEKIGISENDRKRINMVEKEAIALLKVCLKHGHTSIISNGTKSWIDSAMIKFMPKLRAFLKENPVIRVISARDKYMDRYPDKHTTWKIKAFREEIKYRFPETTTVDLLIIGDGRPEKDSAKIFMGREQEFQVRMVRITEKSSIDMLEGQLRFIRTSVSDILNKYGEMNLCFVHA